jgi:hypothetical protein
LQALFMTANADYDDRRGEDHQHRGFHCDLVICGPQHLLTSDFCAVQNVCCIELSSTDQGGGKLRGNIKS